MTKKIEFGKTKFENLHCFLGFENNIELENKKSRLFPSGAGQQNSELATLSIFLSSLGAVKKYREELLIELGCNKINNRNIDLHTYTEIEMSEDSRIDGLIIVTSGRKNAIIEWACFVEAKVGNNSLDIGQIEKYISSSRDIGIKKLVTISNCLATTPTEHPAKIELKNKTKNFRLYHWSWAFLQITASRLINANIVKDVDHIYILNELIKFFETNKNLKAFNTMGLCWRESVSLLRDYEEKQKIKDLKALNCIISNYAQLEKHLSLFLTGKSGLHIKLLATKENRIDELSATLNSNKTTTSSFFIEENKKKTFTMNIDFLRESIVYEYVVKIKNGKAKAQTTKLIKLFENNGSEDDILISAYYPRKQVKSHKNINIPLSNLIKQKETGDAYSVLDTSMGSEIKEFVIRTKDKINFKETKKNCIKIRNDFSKIL